MIKYWCTYFICFSIKGELAITYQGDRTAEDIVQFAEKAGG
jgi:hypothetical protein